MLIADSRRDRGHPSPDAYEHTYGYTISAAENAINERFIAVVRADDYTIGRNHYFTIGYAISLMPGGRRPPIVTGQSWSLRREEVIGRTARTT